MWLTAPRQSGLIQNMADNAEAIKENAQKVAAGEGKETPVVAESENELKLKSLQEQIAKISKERDNYRTGLLKAKGKIDGEETTPEEEEERIRKIVREENLNSELNRLNQEQALVIEKISKDNKELRVALQNRINVSGTPSGGSQDKPEAKDSSYFSEEQKETLRQRFLKSGVKPDKVEQMIKEAEANLRAKK